MSRSRMETFTDEVGKGASGARGVLEQIPAYRARQKEHLKQIVVDQGYGSKNLIPVCEALVNLSGVERQAKLRVGEKEVERILTRAEERLAMQNVIK